MISLNSINSTTMSKTGEIHLIMGCMYSGKSTELLKIINKYNILDIDILVINHSYDTRYGTDKIVSHDGKKYDCLQCDKLMDIINNPIYLKAKVVIVDEGHFFEDLFEFTIQSCDKNNKCVYIAGLNGDYKKEPIGDILKLIPHCDSITKLLALCIMCKDGTPGLFSKRIIKNDSKILVGSGEEYIAVCRKHY